MLGIYTAETYTRCVFIFIESTLFTRLVYDHLSEMEYSALQQFLIDNPESGDIIQGSGGVRKLRR